MTAGSSWNRPTIQLASSKPSPIKFVREKTMNIPAEIEAKIIHSAVCRCGCRAAAANKAVSVDNEASEKEFQAAVVKLAVSLGWKVYHTYNSRRSKSGYPDLTLWRERVIFAELKTMSGQLTASQSTTIEELQAAHAEVHLWRPSMWVEIVRTLT
jgi:hypothetical protein